MSQRVKIFFFFNCRRDSEWSTTGCVDFQRVIIVVDDVVVTDDIAGVVDTVVVIVDPKHVVVVVVLVAAIVVDFKHDIVIDAAVVVGLPWLWWLHYRSKRVSLFLETNIATRSIRINLFFRTMNITGINWAT